MEGRESTKMQAQKIKGRNPEAPKKQTYAKKEERRNEKP
jgi:hypothetical protein